ncbi:MAG: hypothetical protein K1X57_16540 [Gemmataceae bacterium]|nr:hypothetical protein [Gemmataceae bacterium]
MRRIWILLAVLIPLAGATAGQPDDDRKTLEAAGIAPDAPALVAYLRARSIPPEEREKIAGLIRQLADEHYTLREQATADLIARGLPAISQLRAAVNDPDVEVVRRAEKCLAAIERVPTAVVSAAVLRAIARTRPDGVAKDLVAFLPFVDDDQVMEELRDTLAAVAVRGGSADPTLEAALADPSAAVRAVAGEGFARARSPVARRLFTDADRDVRTRICYSVVVRGRDKSSVAALIDRIIDAPDHWLSRVEDVLVRLAGDAAPAVTLGASEADRKKARDAWAEWWGRSAEKVDLAKLDNGPLLVGNTLMVALDTRTGTGRVFEVGPDKTVIWKIEPLQQPSDALVVGRDRVLIAEQSGNQVTMRDFRGNIIWSKQVWIPSGFQALPNGHLLIVSRNQLIEWDAKQNEVFSYQRERYDIIAACKESTGDFVIITSGGECIRISKTKAESKGFKLPGVRSQFVGVEPLAPGKILMTYQGGVGEFDVTDGKKGWAATVSGNPTSVQRLANGNTLVAGSTDKAVVELDRKGGAVWDYKNPELGLVRKARRR